METMARSLVIVLGCVWMAGCGSDQQISSPVPATQSSQALARTDIEMKGRAADPQSPAPATRMSAETNAKYSERFSKPEVPGSHDGKWTSYEAMHRFFVDSFIKSKGFGMERLQSPRSEVRRSVLSINGKVYAIGGVDLISLGHPTKEGMAGEPFVYTTGKPAASSDVMKSMLDKTPTRKLNAFETEALAKLRDGENSLMGDEQGKTLLVGAVRATTSCLACHSVEEGALLGAFTYPLVSINTNNGPARRNDPR